jgi:hypothetical protein
MKELEAIVSDLKSYLDGKERDLNNTKISTYEFSALQNRKIEVALFEKSTRDITSDPTQKENIINNFTKGAAELKKEIDKIG